MEEEIVAIIIVGMSVGALVAIVSIISLNNRRSKEVGYAARLKQLMIERGFSAEEIERIIEASPPTGSDRDWDHIKDFMGRGRKAG